MTISLRGFAAGDEIRLAQIATESEIANGRPRAVSPEEILEELTPPNVDIEQDVVVACDSGEICGYGYTYMLANPDGDERCYLFGFVAPKNLGQGVGTLIFNATFARAREILNASAGTANKFIRADCISTNTAAKAIYQSAGLTEVRVFSELTRPVEPALKVALPPQVKIEPWQNFETETLRQLKNSAFSDHWGSTPTSIENWQQLTSGFGARPDLSFVASHDNAPIGLLLTHRYPLDDELVGGRYGWIDKLATLSQWRGRGVATALIAQAIDCYRDEKLTHAALGVDSDSQTRANHLYESIGFTLLHQTTTFSLTLTK
jgi:GNAT superfamily N-acetyltransferase